MSVFGMIARNSFSAILVLGATLSMGQIGGGGAGGAEPGVWVPASTEVMPNYFSGTNCQASGEVLVGPPPEGHDPSYVVWAELYIEGTSVKTYNWPEGEPGQVGIDLYVTFDSTNFAHNSTVKVQFVAIDNHGQRYPTTGYAEGSAQVKNKAVLFGRDDLEVTPLNHETPGGYEVGDSSWSGVPSAATRLGQMNWFTWQMQTRGWTATDFFPQVQLAQVLYVNTHGSGGIYWTDVNDYNFYYPTDPPGAHPNWTEEQISGTSPHIPSIGAYAVLPYRTAANGTGIPPFNSGVAPITLAFIDGCKAGTDGADHATGHLFPSLNTYSGGQTVNQAFVSYLVDVDAYRTKIVVEEFFDWLKLGWTVGWARDHAYEFYEGYLNDPGSQFGWMSIHGDTTTKIHGVYTGSSEAVAVTAWYR